MLIGTYVSSSSKTGHGDFGHRRCTKQHNINDAAALVEVQDIMKYHIMSSLTGVCMLYKRLWLPV